MWSNLQKKPFSLVTVENIYFSCLLAQPPLLWVVLSCWQAALFKMSHRINNEVFLSPLFPLYLFLSHFFLRFFNS